MHRAPGRQLGNALPALLQAFGALIRELNVNLLRVGDMQVVGKDNVLLQRSELSMPVPSEWIDIQHLRKTLVAV